MWLNDIYDAGFSDVSAAFINECSTFHNVKCLVLMLYMWTRIAVVLVKISVLHFT